MTDVKPPDLIGTADAAKILGVSERTAKRLASSGRLPAAVKMPGETGAYLFRRSDVERMRDMRAAEAAQRAEASA